jgi:uncharacterized membrane protein YkoI
MKKKLIGVALFLAAVAAVSGVTSAMAVSATQRAAGTVASTTSGSTAPASEAVASLPAASDVTTAASDAVATVTDAAKAATGSNAATAAAPSGPHTVGSCTEAELTGDNATKAIAAAKAKVSGATVERAETDCDGAVYEVHMTKSDGSRVTVMEDKNFNVTSVDSGMGGGGHGGPRDHNGQNSSGTTSGNA